MNRYARQMILPEIGEAGQNRLRKAHVLVIGAGGLGCPVLQYLVGAGVGKITLLDPDRVEENNLHRQPLYRMDDIGSAKARAAKTTLLESNPNIVINAHVASLSPANAPDLVKDADVVVDAADSFAVSYILSDVCLAQSKILVSASVLAQSGYVGAFCSGAPSLRAVFPEVPGNGATCATAGVMGAVVGAIGAMQAQLVMQLLIDVSPSPLGRMLTLDFSTFQFGSFSFLSAQEPPSSFPFLARSMISDQDFIVELRGAQEAPEPIASAAYRVLPENLDQLALVENRRIVLCCRSGLRAWRGADMLKNKGHQNLALVAALASD